MTPMRQSLPAPSGRSTNATVALLLALAVIAGALREFLFLNLNYQLDAVTHHRTVSYAHSLFQNWVEGWDGPALLRAKWGMALFFSVLMATACVLLARILCGDHRYLRTILVTYVTAGSFSLVLHWLGGFHPAFGGIGVKLLHALQYPVVLFFVWGGIALARRVGNGTATGK